MSETILLAGGGTGGHVFPMIAVADALRLERPELRLVFLGTGRGMESKLVPQAGYELELREVLPIRGGGLAGAGKGVLRAATSIPEARRFLKQLEPAAVFSIGGYAAGPVCAAAKMLGIPLALMEPNSVIGMANWLIARMVQRAYTAFPEVEKHFREDTILRAGVPLRSGFEPAPYRPNSVLRVLVLGGSQGAKALNEALPELVKRLRARGLEFEVQHQAGAKKGDEVRARYAELGQSAGVSVFEFIDDMPERLASADLVIGRSGASAVSEVCAVGRAAVFVPYPFAAGDHQRFNAESLERVGAARVVLQEDANVERLLAVIAPLLETPSELEAMAAAASERGRPLAARVIARDLLHLAGLEAVSDRRKSSPFVHDEVEDDSPFEFGASTYVLQGQG
ncbi:MAG: undecaprenyldiphospho-muramoylpentapeptide beta-N-acetylglucosaminyltransferase [Polyangiaceae bacterium]